MKSTQRLVNGRNWRPFFIHSLAWALFIAYEVLYIYLLSGSLANPLTFVVNYTLNISLFYFNALVCLPFLIERLKWKWYTMIIAIAVEIAIFVVIKYPVNLLFVGSSIHLSIGQEYYTYVVANSLRAFHYLVLSTAFYLAELNLRRTLEIAKLETQRLIHQNETILLQKDLLQSRNAYLQAQINPHLLFNTLNFLYNASAKVSERLADAVMTLSDIMRYALMTIDEDDKVLLAKEIDHIHNYIKLNQIRYDQKLSIRFERNGEPGGLRIIPLALVTLVENVFKYGDLLDPDKPAVIDLKISNNRLTLHTFNKKRPHPKSVSHGTGIANLRERLDIYYAERYRLNIADSADSFSLTLNLTLTE